MRKQKKVSLNARLGVAIALVVVVLAALIFFGSSHSDEIAHNQSSSEELKEQTTQTEDSPVLNSQTIEETTTSCEDYLFNEGKSLSIDGHNVLVDRISRQGVKLLVDGETATLFEGDGDRLGDGILIELDKGKILYFGVDDVDNAVSLRIGCETQGEDSRDKYVREKGEAICESIYKSCKDSFSID